ncbi:protein-glutamate methylesterase/protein-glutamine glutaminase [Caldicoprobacter algeriensis]|uniref:protein-glutamate methylesterase/protein-glutamine glutaminase n=1 Tax=Caldicoprobacter algeriensis TaxID=699281 RepID=UPI003B84AD6B
MIFLIKVLIADDSAFIRMRIRSLIESDPNIKVVGVARDGIEAVEKVYALRPDIVTMDIMMPRMSGIEAVEKIMATCPTPVILVSSLTSEEVELTLKALENGAIDYVSKEQISEDTLIKKIYMAIESNAYGAAQNRQLNEYKAVHGAWPPESSYAIVCIGISTGGPKALAEVIPNIKPGIAAPIVIAQHMPPIFTKSLAQRLDSISAVSVIEAQHNQVLQPGHVYICPGGMNIAIEKRDVVSLYPKEMFDYIHAPSVDLLMETAGKIYGPEALCIIMTGMGNDGLVGIQKAKKAGSYVIAQSASTCTIFGMPKAIIQHGLHDEIVDLENIASRINALCSG